MQKVLKLIFVNFSVLLFLLIVVELIFRFLEFGYGNAPLENNPKFHHVHPKNYTYNSYVPIGEYGGHVVMYDQFRRRVNEKNPTSTKNKVIFTKFIDVHDLPKYYAASDIYIHPPDKEPYALVISEAIYMECPMILSDRCGSYSPTDDVQPGKNGFVYKCGNISQLANRMEMLAANTELRRQFWEFSHLYAQQSQETSHFFGLKAALTAFNLIV